VTNIDSSKNRSSCKRYRRALVEKIRTPHVELYT
jgi:hypothetical protein